MPPNEFPAAVTTAPHPQPRAALWLGLAALLLAAFNLRPTITSVAAVLRSVGAGYGLSGTWQGILTTLPVLCFGLFAPLAPLLVRRFGTQRTLRGLLIILVFGLLLRPFSGRAGLFLWTVVAGGAIGVLGVLLPAVVKRDYPHRVGMMTGFYTASLTVGAALAAGVTEPLRLAFSGSWQMALAFWLLPAALTIPFWLAHAPPPAATGAPARPARRLLRDPLAWQVTFFMGLQSALAYIVFGWLPSILVDRGLSAVAAGGALSATILVQLLGTALGPWIGSHMRDQRGAVALALIATLIGLGGILYAPMGTLWLWIALLGVGQGAAFTLALSLLALRAPDTATTAQLSAMAQGFGYTVACTGPFITGLIRDASGSWDATGVFFGAIGLLALVAGLGAGRQRMVGARDA